MESFDPIQIGDAVVLVAVVDVDGDLYIPDYTVNHKEYTRRFETMVLGVRPKGTYGAESYGAILIQKRIDNNVKKHNWSNYSDYYKNSHESVPTPGAIYWEIYTPFNIVEHRPRARVAAVLGMPCCECKNGYPYAEANFGDKLVCWSCRDSLRWKYKMVDGKVQLR